MLIEVFDKNNKKIKLGDTVKIITNEKVGERSYYQGRKKYSTAIYKDVESIGVVKFGKCNYPQNKVSCYYVDTDNEISYLTSFFVMKKNDPMTRTKKTIKQPLEEIKKENIEVIEVSSNA